jgi:hypothetical protein
MKSVLKLLAIFFLSIAIISCSDDDGGSNPTDPNGGGGDGGSGDNGSQPVIEFPEFKGPDTDDSKAIKTKAHVQTLNSFIQSASGFVIYSEQADQQGEDWIYNWTSEGINYRLIISNNSDQSVSWTITMDGSSDNVTYDNYTLMEGTRSSDGKEGSWKAYAFDGSGTLEFNLDWVEDEDGVLTAELELPEDNMRYLIVEHPDGTGTIRRYENGTMTFTSTWDNNEGSGQYSEYDEDGNELDSGSWG